MTASRLKSIRGIFFILLLVACFSLPAVILAGDPQIANGTVPPVGYATILLRSFFAIRLTYFVKTWAAYAFYSISFVFFAICFFVLAISRAIKRRDAAERDF